MTTDDIKSQIVDYSIVIPCFNEEENIPLLATDLLSTLKQHAPSFEILLIDDASKDSTAATIQHYCNEHPEIILLNHSTNKGIVESWKTGVSHAKGRFIITLDADMQYSPSDISLLIQNNSNKEYDIIQGIRIYDQNIPKQRKWMSLIFSSILTIVFNLNFKDIKSGFALYKKEKFSKILSYSSEFKFFQHYILLFASCIGCKIKQIPIAFHARHKGKSFIHTPFLFALNALLEIPKAYHKFKSLKEKIQCAG